MPEPKKIPAAFASQTDAPSRDITANIPETLSTDDGRISWKKGFPPSTQKPVDAGGVPPKRADFNGLFNVLSSAAMWTQQGGLYEYDPELNYEKSNIILQNGALYCCKSANGPAVTVCSPEDDAQNRYWTRLVNENGQLSGAEKLGTATVGSTAQPIYLKDGTPTPLSAAVGSSSCPVYLRNGVLSPLSANVGSSTKPVYLKNGTVTELGKEFGSPTAGTVGTTAATSGTTFAIPYVKVNSSGCITDYGTHNHTVGVLTNHSSTAHSLSVCGVKIMWGRATVINSGTPIIRFPTPFSAIHSVVISPMRITGVGVGGTYTLSAVNYMTNTEFCVSAHIERVSDKDNIYVNWIAVGV